MVDINNCFPWAPRKSHPVAVALSVIILANFFTVRRNFFAKVACPSACDATVSHICAVYLFCSGKLSAILRHLVTSRDVTLCCSRSAEAVYVRSSHSQNLKLVFASVDGVWSYSCAWRNCEIHVMIEISRSQIACRVVCS